jgi:malate dehydrogenase
MGMGGVLDTARFIAAIAATTGAQPTAIEAMVIGAHGEAMVPLPSLATVNGVPLKQALSAPDEQLPQILEATVQGGAAVVELLQTGSAFYAPASSIVQMVEAILGNSGTVLSTCAKLQGEYGVENVYMCVPARLGAGGVQEVVELNLAAEELAALQTSAAAIKAQLG